MARSYPCNTRSISFFVTEDDLTAAYRTWYGMQLSSRRVAIGDVAIGAVFGLVAAAFGAGGGTVAMIQGFLIGSIGWIGFMTIVLALSFLNMKANARRLFGLQKNLRDEYHVAWDSAAMDIRTPTITSHLLWTDFVRWAERDTSIIVYQSDYMFNFIPKWAFGEGDLDDLRARLTAAGVPKARVLG